VEIIQKEFEQGNLIVNEDFVSILEKNGLLGAKALWQVDDELVKAEIAERRTGRFYLSSQEANKTEFYIKRYRNASLLKRIKDTLLFKKTGNDAFHEWKALILFHSNLLPTLIPVAAGRVDGWTFDVTLGLKNYKRASELLDTEGGLDPEHRLSLIQKVAVYAARMHMKGFAHQDLYLLHFFIKLPDMVPFLIDLQRVVIQKRLRRRWVIKDLAELLFSSRLVLSEREIDYLFNTYSEEIGFDIRKDKRLFKDIEKKARWMMKRHLRKRS